MLSRKLTNIIRKVITMRYWPRQSQYDNFQLQRLREMFNCRMEYDKLDLFEKFMRSFRGNQFMGYNYHYVFGSYSSNATAVDRELHVKRSNIEYNYEILYWMCGVYMHMCWYYGLTATQCIDIISAKDLYDKFNQLNECGEKRSADKIMDYWYKSR